MTETFQDFNERLMEHLAYLSESVDHLFVVDISGDELWKTYLDSFPAGTNEIYRERREHDCSCCKAFVRQFGAVIAIREERIWSIWDFDAQSDKFQPVIDALHALVVSRAIANVFVTKQGGFGTHHSNELLESGDVCQWHHFRVDLPSKFVTRSSESEGSIAADFRASKEVLERSLSEISPDVVEIVLDLITENTLYKGAEWQGPLQALLYMQREYQSLPDYERSLYCWTKSLEVGPALSRIRNHSIGVLLKDISSGADILDSVKRYERIVAPENYKRPKEIYTKRMVENAQAKVEELGLTESLPRRFARLTDVTVNNVLFADRDAVSVMNKGGVFEQLLKEATQSVGAFRNVQVVGIEEFLRDVLPTTTSMEVLLENRHAGNMVSLIAPENRDAPPLFKWENPFSWAYAGNLTDSAMRQRVRAAGGKVDGALRFSIQWNENGNNNNDLDAHCFESNGNLIYYRRKQGTTGTLDVDIIDPPRELNNRTAVENIVITKPIPGVYKFLVHTFSKRNGRDGFRAEIEFEGQIFEFNYPHSLRQDQKVAVASVTYQNGTFTMKADLKAGATSKQVWSLNTQQFHRVSLVTYSPNFWDENHGTGHQHVFFMLAGTKNDEQPNGFYNEYLREEFMPYKRVFAALGSKMRVSPNDEQLSGVGFSTTRRGSVVVRVDGSKVFKVAF